MGLVSGAALLAISLSSFVFAGCSGRPDRGASSGDESPAAIVDAGAQTVTGTAPAATGSYPSIVILEPIGGGAQPPQDVPPRMDQEQQTFIPSILLVRTGQPVDFLNHDEVLHNVRVRDDATKESAFNVAIPTGEMFRHTFLRDGFYDVGCDIHPGMSAQIVASARECARRHAVSPYTVVADPSGAFRMANVPNGPYKATVYAGARTIEKEIIVAPGAALVDLTSP